MSSCVSNGCRLNTLVAAILHTAVTIVSTLQRSLSRSPGLPENATVLHSVDMEAVSKVAMHITDVTGWLAMDSVMVKSGTKALRPSHLYLVCVLHCRGC